MTAQMDLYLPGNDFYVHLVLKMSIVILLLTIERRSFSSLVTSSSIWRSNALDVAWLKVVPPKRAIGCLSVSMSLIWTSSRNCRSAISAIGHVQRLLSPGDIKVDRGDGEADRWLPGDGTFSESMGEASQHRCCCEELDDD